MRKITLFLMLMVMVLCAIPVFAAPPTEYEIPETGTEINGFVVTDNYYWEVYATDVVKLEHKKTGAVLYWLANDNIERSYQIGFRTPVRDNTGIAHVFEHATLAGSSKYPGANTFSEMVSKTSNTFLNAMTGTYYTLYPMASTSEDQLLRYIDYYMSGLTEPLAIESPYALMREAYRYELDDPDGEISIQGIVYSEMLGALTQSRMANYNFQGMIWPGSYVASISGGDPIDIPNLTMDTVRDFHETYYHPSNATMYLTGDLDLPRFLELLDSDFLSKYDRREIVIEDSNYKPLEPGYYEQTFSHPVETGTSVDKAAIIMYGLPYEISDFNDMMLLNYVCAYMDDESSPLQRMMNDQLPGSDADMYVSMNPIGKNALVFRAESIDESDKEQFRKICDAALAELLEKGVNEDVLHGFLVSEQFWQLTGLDSSSVYQGVAQDMFIDSVVFGDRDIWKYSAEFYKKLNDLATVENLNAAARRYWSDLDTAVMAVTIPVPGLKEENDAALRSKLDQMKAAMTPEEINALIGLSKAYDAFVEESNAVTMPEDLNALTTENLPEEVSYKPASETSVGGIRVITSEVDTPLIRVSFRTDTSAIPFEDLFDFIEYTNLLGVLGTDLYTREELPAKIAAVSSGMALSYGVREEEGTRALKPYFLTRWFALPETLEDSFALVEDILYHTDFSDYDYIRSKAAQSYAEIQSNLDAYGLSFSIYAANSAYSPLAKYLYYVNTEALLNYYDRLRNYSDDEMRSLVGKFDMFRNIMLNKNSAVLTVMGNNENIIRSTALGYNLVGKFDNTVREPVDYAAKIKDLPLHYAIVTGGNVVFNVSGTDLEAAGYEGKDGGLEIICKVIDDKLLYPEIRVKNSAYGSYSLLSSDYFFGYYSYRDPNVAETFDVYASAGDFLRNLEISQSELDGYIISVYGDLTAPIGPLSAALTGISDCIDNENTYEDTLKKIRDIKAFKLEDIAKYADLAGAAGAETASRATGGMRSMIEANAGLFDSINYDMINAAGDTKENGSDEELLAVIRNLTADDIRTMLANMDEDDLQSLVEYVMDQFTDPETGVVDTKKVFELVGSFMGDSRWSKEEIDEAVEELEEDHDDDKGSAENSSETDIWKSMIDSVFSQIDKEKAAEWLYSVEEAASERAAEVLLYEESLANFLEGIFGAYILSAND